MILTLSFWLLFITALLSFQIASFLRSRSENSRSGRVMAWLMGATTLWSLFNAFELMASDLWVLWALANIQYVAIAFIPALWFRFGTRLERRDDHTRATWWKAETLLWVVPTLTAVFVWTDPWWGLVRSGFHLKAQDGFVLLGKTFGPWFWVHSAYSYLFVLWGTLRVFRALIVKSKTGAVQALILCFAALIPTLANLLYLTNLWPFAGVDPTPLAFSITGLLFVLTLSRFRFLALLPAAQDSVIASLEQAVLIFDLGGRLMFVNAAAARLFSLARLAGGQTLDELVPTHPTLAALRDMRTQQGKQVALVQEVELLDENGAERRFEVHLNRVERKGNSIAFAYLCHDVTLRARTQRELESRVAESTAELRDSHHKISSELDRRKETEKQLFYFSLHDPLTGLPNRSLLLNRLEQALERYRREPSHLFALLSIDFGQFKAINDGFGHAVGDAFLREAGTRLLAAVRTVDTVSRLGGDEFIVLLDKVNNAQEALEVAQRIADDLSVPINSGSDTIVPTTNIGVLAAKAGYTNAEDLLRDADLARSFAKAAGKDQQVPFDESMRTTVQEKTRLRNDLNKAILGGQIEVHYQPIVRLSDGQLVGCEALARWTHPELGRIGPDRFIPIAEESGLIVPLGLSVLMQACRTAATLAKTQPDRPLFIAVNVSSLQLIQAGFAEVLMSCLERQGLKTSALHLEITESALIQGPDAVQSLLKGLVDQGFQFKLDDFGTGYSSLAYLHRFPIQTIKIDQSFVRGIPGSSEGILKGIVSLGHELGKDLVAEGIETEEQAGMLRDWGCDYGQGYLFSKPLPLDSWLEFAKR